MLLRCSLESIFFALKIYLLFFIRCHLVIDSLENITKNRMLSLKKEWQMF